MSTAEVPYSFRRPYADSLQRARAQAVKLEAWHNGALVAPTASGSTFTLLDPSGVAVIDAEPITVVSSIATYAIAANELPATLGFSNAYMQRWVLVMPDSTTRTVQRECCLAPYPVQPSVTQADLLEEYPDLATQVGTGITDLQDWMDAGWKRTMRRLFKVERWPDLMVSTDGFFDVHLEQTYALIFKFLLRGARGGADAGARWKQLWDHHEAQLAKAWGEFTSRLDEDFDGLADSTDRPTALPTVIHRNVVPSNTRSIRRAF